jgi:hypothetical protein
VSSFSTARARRKRPKHQSSLRRNPENNSDDEIDEDEEDDDGFDTKCYNSDEDAIQYGEDNVSRADFDQLKRIKRIKKPNGKEKGRKEKKKAKLVGNESSPKLNLKNVDELDKRASLDSNDLSKV